MNDDKPEQGSTIVPELWEHGRTINSVNLWDLSQLPATNDREAKLGNHGGQLGAAIALFDPDLGTRALVDGYHGVPVTSLMPFEPDNWNPRLHEEQGDGLDNVWALRLITDHANPSSTRQNRSTHWIDQEQSQEWALSDDLFRIVEKQTPVDDPEVQYTMAGFLGLLTGAEDPKGLNSSLTIQSQGGKATRGALALDTSRNLGFIADTKNFGQLSHALVFLKVANPDVATEDNTQTRPPVPSIDSSRQGTVSNLPNMNTESNPAANTTPTVSSNPQFNNGESNPGALAPGSTVGGQFSVQDGQLYLNGQPVTSQPVSEDPGNQDSAPQIGGRARQENELGLRLDVGFLCDSKGLVARLTDKQPPADASEGDGEVRLCTFFVMKADAPPDDHLDTLIDDNSNHELLPKPVKKKKFAAWVKVPQPGSSECHHYDYSWHNPPPESSSSGGSSSMSGVATTDGGGGGSGHGSTTPAGPTTSPGDNSVPTVDRYTPPPEVPSTLTSAASTQVQHGFAPPRSPGYSIRGNIFPKLADANPVGSFVATKAKTYRNVILELVICFSDDLISGELIELNAILGAHVGSEGPSVFYRQCLLFKGTEGYVSDPKEYTARFHFDGFATDEQIFTVLIERRNDTEKGTNSSAELCIVRSSLLSAGGTPGGTNA